MTIVPNADRHAHFLMCLVSAPLYPSDDPAQLDVQFVKVPVVAWRLVQDEMGVKAYPIAAQSATQWELGREANRLLYYPHMSRYGDPSDPFAEPMMDRLEAEKFLSEWARLVVRRRLAK
jgi:hypothetical protein